MHSDNRQFLVSWCFKPSKQQRFIPGLTTNLGLSLSYLTTDNPMSQPSVKTTANTTGIYHVKYHKIFLLCLTTRSSVQHLRAAVSSEMIPLPSTKDAAPMATCRSAGSPPLCVFILTVTVVFSPTLAEWCRVTRMAVEEFRRMFCVQPCFDVVAGIFGWMRVRSKWRTFVCLHP